MGPSGAEGPMLLPLLLLVVEGWESAGCDSCEREEETLLDLLCVECCEPGERGRGREIERERERKRLISSWWCRSNTTEVGDWWQHKISS